MKKIIFCSLCTLACLSMIGCSSSSSDNAVKILNTQLDKIDTCLTNVNSEDLALINSYSASNNFGTQELDYSKNNVYNAYSLKNKVVSDVNVQYALTNQILDKTSEIQSSIKNSKKTFNNNQINALNNLSGELNTYLTKIKDTEGKAKSGLKLIKQSKKSGAVDGLGAGYNSVSNVLEMRKAYYVNVLNTLDQIQGVVDGETKQTENQYGYYIGDVEDLVDEKDLPAQDTEIEQEENKEHRSHHHRHRRNINIPDYAENNVPPVVNYPPYYNQFGAYPYGYNYGRYNMYNNMYNNRANPTRNTDSYRPNYVNIDTYKLSPNSNGIIRCGFNIKIRPQEKENVVEEEEVEQDSTLDLEKTRD